MQRHVGARAAVDAVRALPGVAVEREQGGVGELVVERVLVGDRVAAGVSELGRDDHLGDRLDELRAAAGAVAHERVVHLERGLGLGMGGLAGGAGGEVGLLVERRVVIGRAVDAQGREVALAKHAAERPIPVGRERAALVAGAGLAQHVVVHGVQAQPAAQRVGLSVVAVGVAGRHERQAVLVDHRGVERLERGGVEPGVGADAEALQEHAAGQHVA